MGRKVGWRAWEKTYVRLVTQFCPYCCEKPLKAVGPMSIKVRHTLRDKIEKH